MNGRSDYCSDCGSPSWRNGPCWWERVVREADRRAGRKFDQEAFNSGGDPPCAGRQYDGDRYELRRDSRRVWITFIVVAIIIVSIAVLVSGCGDYEAPQEQRQREAVNAPPSGREFITLGDRVEALESRVNKLERQDCVLGAGRPSCPSKQLGN